MFLPFKYLGFGGFFGQPVQWYLCSNRSFQITDLSRGSRQTHFWCVNLYHYLQQREASVAVHGAGSGTALGTVPLDRAWPQTRRGSGQRTGSVESAAGALSGLPGSDMSEGRGTWRPLSRSAVLLLESRDGWGRGEQEHGDTNLDEL